MRKYFNHIIIFSILVLLIIPIGNIHAQGTGGGGGIFPDIAGAIRQAFIDAVTGVLSTVAYIALTIVAFFLGLAGSILDFVMQFTIIDLRQNISGLTGINIAWKLIKDLMNIVFIFMLLYQGIKLIIGQESTQGVKSFILGIVLSAILINFSLFFTKVLIDASNIIATGFYQQITSQTAVIQYPGQIGSSTIGGISAPFMNIMQLNTFWSPGGIDAIRNINGSYNAVILPFMGIFLFGVLAFVFLAMSAIFAVRFVALLILLILSPVAYMGLALNGMRGYANQWWNALTSQLIFAPLFMIMMWVILTLMGSQGFLSPIGNGASWTNIVGTGTQASSGIQIRELGLIFNFFIVIGLTFASLFISKSTSSKGSTYIGQMTGMATKATGTMAFGLTSWGGRRFIGGAGNLAADNQRLQEAANKERSGFFDRAKGFTARTALYTAKSAKEGTFDVRNIDGSSIGDAVRGTVGRTRVGKFLGADNAQTSIPLVSSVSNATGFGAGTKNTYASERKKYEDEVKKRKEDAKNDLLRVRKKASDAETKKIVKDGADDNTDDPNNEKLEAMQVAMAKQTDKQTEELVASNRELLDSQKFANALSVRQLDAILKSDKFTDDEKNKIKESRFKDILDVKLEKDTEYMRIKALDENSRSQEDKDTLKMYDERIKKANTKIKGLSDKEIEELDQSYLSDSDVVSRFRSGQYDMINSNKNGKFTTTQRKFIKDTRIDPLLNALDMGEVGNNRSTYITDVAKREKILDSMIKKDLSPKDLAGLASQEVYMIDPSDPTGNTRTKVSLINHPEVIKRLKGNRIKKMVEEMSDVEHVEKFGDTIQDMITANENSIAPDPRINKLQQWMRKPENQDLFL